MGGNEYAKRIKLKSDFLESSAQLDLDDQNGFEPLSVEAIVILDRPIAMTGMQVNGMGIDWTKFPQENIVLAIADSIQNLAVDVLGIERDAVSCLEKVQLVSEGFAKPILEIRFLVCNIATLNKIEGLSLALELFMGMTYGYANDSKFYPDGTDSTLIQYAKLHADRLRELHGGKEAQTAFRIMFQERELSCFGRVKPLAQKVSSDEKHRIVRGQLIKWNSAKFLITLKPGTAAMIELTYAPEGICWRELRNCLGESENLEFVIAESSVGERKIMQLVSFEKIKTELF